MTDLRDHVITDRIGWPQPDPLPRDDSDTPWYVIDDEAFAWLMEPFSGRHMQRGERIFNCRLLRARGVAESACGMLATASAVCSPRCSATTARSSPSSSPVSACTRSRWSAALTSRMAWLTRRTQQQVIPGAWRRGRTWTTCNKRGGQRQHQGGQRATPLPEALLRLTSRQCGTAGPYGLTLSSDSD